MYKRQSVLGRIKYTATAARHPDRRSSMTTTRLGVKTATPVRPISPLPASVCRHRMCRRARPRQRLDPGLSLSTPTTARPSVSKRCAVARRSLCPDLCGRAETSTGRCGARRPVSPYVYPSRPIHGEIRGGKCPTAVVRQGHTNPSHTIDIGLRPTAYIHNFIDRLA